jgi:predicted nucleic acid-binding protein
MLVLDASAAIDLLARTTRGVKVAEHLARDDVAAPELLDVEVLSALWRLVRAGELTETAATRAAARMRAMPVLRVRHELLTEQVWVLRHRVRIADAFYLSCGRLLGGTLITTDGRLARAPLPGLSVTFLG